MNLLSVCARGQLEILKEYLRKYRDRTKYQIYDNHSWGPLHHAVVSNSLECVSLLLSSKLVDLRWRSYEGQTALYVAVDRAVSCSIIKLLLKEDPELFNLADNEKCFPIHKAISRNSMEIVTTMVETLKEIEFVIQDQFDLDGENSLILAVRQKNIEMVNYILQNIKCNVKHTSRNYLDAVTIALLPGDPKHNQISFEIFKILVPLTYKDFSDNTIRRLLPLLIFASFLKDHQPFKWIMEQFYIIESNAHSDLVRRAMDSFCNSDVDYRLILIGIHSKISQYSDQHKNKILYRNIFSNFQAVLKHDRNLFAEIVVILGPKLHLKSLKYSIMKFIPTFNLYGTDTANSLIEIFDVMNLGNLIDIIELLRFTPSTTYLNNIFLLFMPFSNAITADVYVQYCIDTHSSTLLTNYEEDLGLARFCVNGKFRIKNDLKGLCRKVIRMAVISNSIEMRRRIKSLNLPNQIINYLLFNYSNYKL